MSKPTLIYYDARARAEVARLIFAESGTEYEDKRITDEEWVTLKPTLPFGQVPVLQIDGETIAQSYTINRFLAKRFGLYGKTDLEAAKADMVVDAIIDIATATMAAKTDEEKKKFASETLPKHLGNLENLLKKNGGEFFTGSFTYADITFANRWYSLSTDWAESMKTYPLLQSLYERVTARPGIAKWLKERPVTKY